MSDEMKLILLNQETINKLQREITCLEATICCNLQEREDYYKIFQKYEIENQICREKIQSLETKINELLREIDERNLLQ